MRLVQTPAERFTYFDVHFDVVADAGMLLGAHSFTRDAVIEVDAAGSTMLRIKCCAPFVAPSGARVES